MHIVHRTVLIIVTNLEIRSFDIIDQHNLTGIRKDIGHGSHANFEQLFKNVPRKGELTM
jgi:hypothetical protein